jgi:hypothetical protein
MLGSAACSSGPNDATVSATKSAVGVPDSPVTGFGGYHLSGSVTDLSAGWLVPRITGGPSDAHASTWIGVQDSKSDFIQIGTIEDDWAGMRRYSAFWSDPDVGFHPQSILSVSPGDEVSARLSEGSGGWSGRIEDVTKGRTSTVPASIHYAKGSAMQLSEWVQEDPSILGGTVDESYPTTTQVTFTDLRVDNKAPALTPKDATALASPNGVVLVPSVVQGDGFSFEQGTQTQGQYLRDVSGFDSAINRFDDPRLTGGGTTAANGRALVTAIATFDSHLSTQQWPSGSMEGIQRLTAHNQLLIGDLHAWAAAGESNVRLARFRADARLDSQFANVIRSDLGLPPV